MSFGVALLWILATGVVVIFCKFYLIPTITNKVTFWRFSRMMSKMAKKYKGQPAYDDLMKLSEMFKKAAKDEKLIDDEED